MRKIDVEQIDNMAIGAAVLGTGGGGNPYIGRLMAQSAIRTHGPATMIDAAALADDDLIVAVAMMGAPTVMVEKIPAGNEVVVAFQMLEEYVGQKFAAVMCGEVGGLNSVVPFALAATLGIRIVDADGMGRAFPELQMGIPAINGARATPMAIADEKGNGAVLNTISNKWTENLARQLTIEMGCSAMVALYMLTGKQCKEWAILGSLTKVEEIGLAIRAAHAEHRNPVQAVCDITGGSLLWNGKISDIQRRTEAGFARGEAFIDGLGDYAGQQLRIAFQNEFLIAQTDDRVVATTPDLITMLDAETGEPITTEDLRYGFRVAVLGIPCDPRWRSPIGIETVGPRYFGYDIEYVPIEDRLTAAG